jgi:hypothetical protein
MADTASEQTPTLRRLQALSQMAKAQRQTLRVQYMDHLYQQSGRTCGTYSGLWQQHKAALLDEFAQHLAEEERVLWGLDK